MKSAKDRKMERKRKNKALSVAKTVKSRQRRLDNKAKRDEIHAINPDIKVVIKDQVTYDEDGNTITVYNNALSITSSIIKPTVKVFNPEIEEVEVVEVDDVGRFRKLTNKWRL